MNAVVSIIFEDNSLAPANKASNETELSATASATPMSKASAVYMSGNCKSDADKVARTKAQLACGEYEISPSRIDSRMVG